MIFTKKLEFNVFLNKYKKKKFANSNYLRIKLKELKALLFQIEKKKSFKVMLTLQ